MALPAALASLTPAGAQGVRQVGLLSCLSFPGPAQPQRPGPLDQRCLHRDLFHAKSLSAHWAS